MSIFSSNKGQEVEEFGLTEGSGRTHSGAQEFLIVDNLAFSRYKMGVSKISQSND